MAFPKVKGNISYGIIYFDIPVVVRAHHAFICVHNYIQIGTERLSHSCFAGRQPSTASTRFVVIVFVVLMYSLSFCEQNERLISDILHVDMGAVPGRLLGSPPRAGLQEHFVRFAAVFRTEV